MSLFDRAYLALRYPKEREEARHVRDPFLILNKKEKLLYIEKENNFIEYYLKLIGFDPRNWDEDLFFIFVSPLPKLRDWCLERISLPGTRWDQGPIATRKDIFLFRVFWHRQFTRDINFYWGALIKAITLNYQEAVRDLIDNPPWEGNPNLSSHTLYYACLYRKKEIIKYLLERGVRPDEACLEIAQYVRDYRTWRKLKSLSYT